MILSIVWSNKTAGILSTNLKLYLPLLLLCHNHPKIVSNAFLDSTFVISYWDIPFLLFTWEKACSSICDIHAVFITTLTYRLITRWSPPQAKVGLVVAVHENPLRPQAPKTQCPVWRYQQEKYSAPEPWFWDMSIRSLSAENAQYLNLGVGKVSISALKRSR